MNSSWLSVEKVSGLEGISKQAIRKRIQTGYYPVDHLRQVPGIGGRGMIWEILIEDNNGAVMAPDQKTHPTDAEQSAQHAHANARGMHTPNRGRGDALASTAGTNVGGDAACSLAAGSVSPEARGIQIIDNTPENIIRKNLAVAEVRLYTKKIGKEKALEAAAKKYGMSTITIRRHMKQSKPQKSKDRNMQNINGLEFATQLPSKLVEYIVRQKLTKPRQTIREIYHNVKDRLRYVADRKQYTTVLWDETTGRGNPILLDKIPSERAFERIIEQIPDMLIIRSLSGRRGLETNVAPYVCRDLMSYEALELVVGDQHIFDWIVQTDDGRYIRPEGYFWVDMRSRFWCGIQPCLWHYNSFDVATSLMRVCENYGIPAGIYTDWGKSETSKYVDNVISQLGGYGVSVYDWDNVRHETDQIKHEKAIVRNAKAKTIEGYFSTLEMWLQNELQGVGYCKRLKDSHEDELMIENLKKDKRAGRILGWQEFFSRVMKVIDKWNKHLVSTDKIVPEEEFFGRLSAMEAAGAVKRLPQSTLQMIFLPAREHVKVRNSIIGITFGRQEIGLKASRQTDPAELDLDHRCRKFHCIKLSEYNGGYVDVRYNPYDASQVYIFEPGSDRLVGIAEAWDRIDPKSEPDLAAAMQKKNDVIRYWEGFYKQFTGTGRKGANTTHKLDRAARNAVDEQATLDEIKHRKKHDPILRMVMESTL